MPRIFLILSLLFSTTALSQLVTQDFKPDQVSFDFVGSEGGFWYDCTHARGQEPHAWIVKCNHYEFKLHLFMIEYVRDTETTYELHYWADEIAGLFETHTQSTWLTVDRAAKAKKIVAYLGFQKDASQLRLEVNLTSAAGISKRPKTTHKRLAQP